MQRGMEAGSLEMGSPRLPGEALLPVTSLPSPSSPPPSPPLCPHLSALRTLSPSHCPGYTHLSAPQRVVFLPVVTPPPHLHKTHPPPLGVLSLSRSPTRSAATWSPLLLPGIIHPKLPSKPLLGAPMWLMEGQVNALSHVSGVRSRAQGAPLPVPLPVLPCPPQPPSPLSLPLLGQPLTWDPEKQQSQQQPHGLVRPPHLLRTDVTHGSARRLQAPSRRRVKSPRFPLLLFFVPAASLFSFFRFCS